MARILFFFILLSHIIVNAQTLELGINFSEPIIKFQTGKDVIEFLYQKYKQGPCKIYTFSQKNTHYRNDSVIGNSEWHEYIEFPDKFRIDFGNKTEGNFVIFKNDSSYSYRNHEFKKVKYNTNTLLLLLGGMYYRDLADVNMRLINEHYNTQILSNQKKGNHNFCVIGALAGDTLSNQIWVSKKNWRIVRIIEKMDENSYMDMTFDAFQKSCNGYTETKVTFKRNGKIEQIEEYYDIKAQNAFPTEIFYPKKQ